MFTGIVEELGEVVAIERLPDAARVTIRGEVVADGTRHGDSISVNGVCLTAVDIRDGCFSADVMAETLRRSSLAAAVVGTRVNLERALQVGARLGGHLVQGHVDATGVVTARRSEPHWDVVHITLPPELARYVVSKGSVTVDGVSLTVVDVTADSFSVSLIPTTLSSTTLGAKQVGDAVNLEVDVVAKYVERMLQHAPGAPAAGSPPDTEQS